MALDIKLFAPVARATNAIYMYVVHSDMADSPAKDDTVANITAANYFSNAELVGSVKKGDIIFVNAQGSFAVLIVTAVAVKAKTITVSKVVPAATGS